MAHELIEEGYQVDRRCAGPALALSAVLSGRISAEKMRKIVGVHRARDICADTLEKRDVAIVQIKVTPQGNPMSLTEPYKEFPSDTMLAQIMLVL